MNLVIAVLMLLHLQTAPIQQLPPGFDLKIRLDPPKATVGDPIRIQFDFVLPDGFKLVFPNVDPQIGEFTILEKFSNEPAAAQSGIHRVHLAVAAYKTGEFEFPPLAFVLHDSEGKEIPAPSPAVKIRIDSVLGREDTDLKDLKKQAEMPEPVRWLLWTGLTAAVLVAALTVWFWKKRRRSGIDALVPAPEADPLDLAEAALRALLKRGLVEKGAIKQFYIEISDIVKKGLEAGCRVATLEQTTSEIMSALSRAPVRLEPATVEQIESFLISCDVVKFARYIPAPHETDDCVRRAGSILSTCRAQRALHSSGASRTAEGV